MRLSEAEPTPTYSSSSDEMGKGNEDGEGMGLLGRGDDSLLSIPDTEDNYQHHYTRS